MMMATMASQRARKKHSRKAEGFAHGTAGEHPDHWGPPMEDIARGQPRANGVEVILTGTVPRARRFTPAGRGKAAPPIIGRPAAPLQLCMTRHIHNWGIFLGRGRTRTQYSLSPFL